jgi:hypothetical protein
MTPDEFRACLATLHWTLIDLSHAFGGLDELLIQRWNAGRYRIPDWLAERLADLARYHDEHPPPPHPPIVNPDPDQAE